jgi:DNA-3-methyladenine glycosylase II
MTEALVDVVPPYRLDLTVAVLRRFSTNLVDVAHDGVYARALTGFVGPVVVSVRQASAAQLTVAVDGAAGEEARALALVRRMLGTERRTPIFDRGAAKVPWLRGLAKRVLGVKPPRYPTLWEACVNAIVFQQVSIYAAGAILRRTIEALGSPIEREGFALHAFPSIEAFLAADDSTLQRAGLSRGKIATLRRAGEALAGGTLDEAMLEERSTPEAAELLCGIKGIGPWTAAVILLRGLGRLDLFPQNDSGVARSLALLGGAEADVQSTFAALGAERGMLYYHLLLARLEARGEIATR